MLAPGLWLVAVGLLLLARNLLYRLEADAGRWARVLGIVMGASAGLALGLVAATLLNPWVGLVPGSFHNLAFFAICLGFLGLCTGALGGLLYAGMSLSDETRIDEAGDGTSWEETFTSVRGGQGRAGAASSAPAVPRKPVVEADDAPRGAAPQGGE